MTPADRIGPGEAATDVSPAVGRGEQERSRAEVRRLAQEFEAMLLTQVLKDMRRSMVDAEDESPEFGAMTDTIDTEFGRSISAVGGFGLSATLMEAIERLAGGSSTTGAVQDATAMSAVLGPAMEVPAGRAEREVGDRGVPRAAADLAAPVTSGFGWRRDPLTGTPGFHAGVDIGLAYGRDVRAVAPGRVTFAGERGGYGNMVAVTHPDGRETRYGHLASISVREGDMVEAEQSLGASGNSGRATGPHLHFEVLVNGRPVDPLEPGIGR